MAPTPQEELEYMIRKLRRVYEAARGLCHGYDWNEGTHAKLHGYRERLVNAVNAIEELPDPIGVARLTLTRR